MYKSELVSWLARVSKTPLHSHINIWSDLINVSYYRRLKLILMPSISVNTHTNKEYWKFLILSHPLLTPPHQLHCMFVGNEDEILKKWSNEVSACLAPISMQAVAMASSSVCFVFFSWAPSNWPVVFERFFRKEKEAPFGVNGQLFVLAVVEVYLFVTVSISFKRLYSSVR